jgi:cation diffusion facilitator CzcD-associated flavoprotein CzcO
MERDVKDLIIIGAGPYGLATAAYARQAGLDYLVLGRPMAFWRANMLDNLVLRSPPEWHVDPTGKYTIAAFKDQFLRNGSSDFFTKDNFLSYIDWFCKGHDIVANDVSVRRVKKSGSIFEIDAGSQRFFARNVVVATGLRQFRHFPAELLSLTEVGRATHTSDHADYDFLEGKSVLIVGGRQSAYEAVKELSNSPDTMVHVSHRHLLPSFEASDWSWIDETVALLLENPRWFSDLALEAQRSMEQRFWLEGRHKLEPWLAEAVARPNVDIHPSSHIVSVTSNGERIHVDLSDGASLSVDHLLCATGYKVDLDRVEILRELVPQVATADGYPTLDSSMQSSISNLFFSGLFCTRRFGPIFGFALGCQVAPIITINQILSA